MPPAAFLVYSAIGTIAWTSILTRAGFWLRANYASVSAWVDPASVVILIAFAGLYLWRITTFIKRMSVGSPED